MSKTKATIALAILSALAGCETNKTPVPTGGSKADGLVEMSYDVGGFDVPKVDWATADKSALARCRAWGYGRADPFEGVKTQCTSYSTYGCMAQTVTKVYQCID